MKKFLRNKDKSILVAKNAIHLLGGCVILAIGIVLIVQQDYILVPVIYAIGISLIVFGIADMIGWFFKRERVWYKLVIPLGYTVAGGLILLYNQIPLYVLTVIFGCYLLFSAIVEFISAYLILKNRSGEFFFALIPGLIYLTFSLLLILTPASYKYAMFIVMGIYFILFGSTWILDFIYSVIPLHAKRKIKRRIRISLPAVLVIFLPHAILQDLNHFLEKEGNQIQDFEDIKGKKDNNAPDLEIYFHIAKTGFNAIGHCDICFENELIAYGNYDEAAQKKIGVGPGVLLISNKEQYIPFCLEFNKTTIFSFGLRLNEEQKKQVRDRINEIKSWVYPWDPPYVADCKRGACPNVNDYTDFPSHLSHAANALYYKFTKSKFKTYFVLTTNCVALAEDITCRAGTDILGMSGIISPGTFFDYLQSEYLRKGSMVISRDVYQKENAAKV